METPSGNWTVFALGNSGKRVPDFALRENFLWFAFYIEERVSREKV